MKLITRYIIGRMSVSAVYALLAFLALYSFFEVIDQAGDVGQGGYTGMKMAQYVLFQMPAHAYELMPLAVLIGGLLSLSQLASGSELTVMKASGMSTKKLLLVLSQFGLIFALATVAVGEWVAPQLSRYAENMKAGAVNGAITAGSAGLWLKEKDNIVNVREMLPDRTLRDIKIWQYDENYRLVRTQQAESAVLDADGSWRLKNVGSSLLGDKEVKVLSENEVRWPIEVKSSLLDVLLVQPEQMSLSELTAYIGHLESNRQKTRLYDIEWWRKLAYPVAAWVMALVAFAFTPQNTRHGNMGLKLFGGICLGLLFHFAGRLFGFSAQLYGIPPFVAGTLPTVLFALLAVFLIRKQEKR